MIETVNTGGLKKFVYHNEESRRINGKIREIRRLLREFNEKVEKQKVKKLKKLENIQNKKINKEITLWEKIKSLVNR